VANQEAKSGSSSLLLGVGGNWSLARLSMRPGKRGDSDPRDKREGLLVICGVNLSKHLRKVEVEREHTYLAIL